MTPPRQKPRRPVTAGRPPARSASNGAGASGGPSLGPVRTDTSTRLVEVMGRLESLMTQEVSLLRGAKARDIEALHDDKSRLADLYHRLVLDVQRGGGLGGAGAATRRRLAHAARGLARASRNNEIALKAAIQANDSLMQAIADAVQRESGAGATYARNGRLAYGGPHRHVQPAAVSLNRTL